MEYRFEAKSVEGFVQMLASNYLLHGYWSGQNVQRIQNGPSNCTQNHSAGGGRKQEKHETANLPNGE